MQLSNMSTDNGTLGWPLALDTFGLAKRSNHRNVEHLKWGHANPKCATAPWIAANVFVAHGTEFQANQQ